MKIRSRLSINVLFCELKRLFFNIKRVSQVFVIDLNLGMLITGCKLESYQRRLFV